MTGIHKPGAFETTGHGMGVVPIVHPGSPEERHHAVRAVASLSVNAIECAEVLAMLGLDPAEGKAQ
ncbi:hypothetical protein ACIBCH_09805 [Amycolatopsis thailandensis]|uniref:hypothetical protein n=1 Tax=Amycolatopsis thailandensis TaxID=589330 RepID=UPI0037B964C8